MRRIHKGAEPPSLAQHRARQDLVPTYTNYLESDDARHLANEEQRDLCAFCQKRTKHRKTAMVLAHVVPQKDPVDGERLQLTWTNIVSSCNGGEIPGDPKTRPPLRHCDKLQANTRLHTALDPVNFVNGSLSYDEYGGIYSADPSVQDQLDKVLGLTIPRLQERRLSALLALQDDLKPRADWESRRQEILQMLDPAHTRGEPLMEYADFLRWHLLHGFLVAPSPSS